MVCCPCFVIPFLLWLFLRYIRPIIEKCCPSLLKYLPGNSKGEESSGKCPLNKTDNTKSSPENSTETITEMTAGDGMTKKTN